MYLEASWHVPEISALRRWKQMDPDVKTSLRSQKTSQNTCYRENGGREGKGKREEGRERDPTPPNNIVLGHRSFAVSMLTLKLRNELYIKQHVTYMKFIQQKWEMESRALHMLSTQALALNYIPSPDLTFISTYLFYVMCIRLHGCILSQTKKNIS